MKQIIIALTLLILYPKLAATKPIYKENTKWYSIYGKSSSEIYKSIKANTPQTYAGYTNWQINWSFKWKQENDNCVISSAKIFLNNPSIA